ncbi:hypothetical protein L1987_36774 [Smallanthus sonchifolius]|uniref:Uncharacterized protein n=1 Tax=Smallanthus sonchifolius TaxID=185202 RepID=A0ACB9HFR9_9ASTR|nr:hypothetical protein L1987_36774 [Smallanthus sonchifolius]
MGISMGEDDLYGYNSIGNSVDEDRWLAFNNLHVVGSCNGLVCVSPRDAVFIVTNPSTSEHQMKLPMPPHPPLKYVYVNGISGILCGGALHWFMSDDVKKVIIYLDLSTEEFKEIPQSADEEYECTVLMMVNVCPVLGAIFVLVYLSRALYPPVPTIILMRDERGMLSAQQQQQGKEEGDIRKKEEVL